MPPSQKFKREDIIQVAYTIVEKEGLDCLNARKVAKSLGCSVQPIFHNFASMDELMKEVYQKIYTKYKEYMLYDLKSVDAYKQSGLSYIRFAADYPELFKILFMQSTNLNAEEFVMADSLGDHIIQLGQTFTGLSYEEQKKFHTRVWIFTHGIACLVATKTIQFSDLEIDELLKCTVGDMLRGYHREKENVNEK